MQLPGPVRAFVGLLAVTAEEAKHLPDRAIELPMLAVSSALQMSLRAQQRYARLAARGDDVINGRPAGDEPPPWATFDEPVSADEMRAVGLSDPDPALRARAASQLLDELFSDDAGAADTAAAQDRPPARSAANNAGRSRAPAKKPPATRKQPVRAATRTAGPAAKKQPAKRTVATKAVAKKPGAAAARTDKAINAPRHTAPSRFDTVQDD